MTQADTRIIITIILKHKAAIHCLDLFHYHSGTKSQSLANILFDHTKCCQAENLLEGRNKATFYWRYLQSASWVSFFFLHLSGYLWNSTGSSHCTCDFACALEEGELVVFNAPSFFMFFVRSSGSLSF